MRAFGRIVIVAALSIGCEEPAKKAPTASSAAKEAPPPAAAPAKDPNRMPSLTVDNLGPYLDGKRVKMDDEDAKEKLDTIVGELPLEGKDEVELVMLKDAMTPAVVAVVNALGKAGAKKVRLKTDGRDDLPKEVVVTPESQLGDVPACSVVAMVRDDLGTAVWSLSGGTAINHRKGFAGPDLSHTSGTLEKQFPKCKSSVAFFASAFSNKWELAHNLAGTLLQSDKEKQLDTIVLLAEEPVAGRPVEIAK